MKLFMIKLFELFRLRCLRAALEQVCKIYEGLHRQIHKHPADLPGVENDPHDDPHDDPPGHEQHQREWSGYQVKLCKDIHLH